MTTQQYREFSIHIPTDPGVYRFLDKHNHILYVGKAKNLKNRLNSYFSQSHQTNAKTKALVRHAHHIEFTVVETEHDALLMENNFIKIHQPRYNVMLKDGKTYSYICIKKEAFPRVFFTRKPVRDGSLYFGPYTSKFKTQVIVELIRQIFPLRTCNLLLTQQAIARNKYKVCLEYHIHHCQGPCTRLESEEEYNEKIIQIKNILRGHFRAVKEFITERMKFFASQELFEQAHEWKLKLDVLEDYHSKSSVVSSQIKDVDVFSVAVDEKMAYINYLKVIDGAVIHTLTIEAEKNAEEEVERILSVAIHKIRDQFESQAPELIVPFPLELENQNLVVTVPQRGDKKSLLDLSEKNVTLYQLQKRKEALQMSNKQSHSERILKTLQADLNLSAAPIHIECFDNSNIQGTNPVAACVVFKHAKASKKDYRHFKIKTVQGPDDFASMQEVVYRRYKRLLDEESSLPQLVIIDGGKGQLSSAMKAITSLALTEKIQLIGIAKKLEEIYFPDDPVPLHLNKKSESLKLIQQLRNEAHRFGLNFHRQLRSKAQISSALSNIPGIGPKTSQKLLSHFGSIQRIAEAPPDEIIGLAGKSAAQKILNFLSAQDETHEEVSNQHTNQNSEEE